MNQYKYHSLGSCPNLAELLSFLKGKGIDPKDVNLEIEEYQDYGMDSYVTVREIGFYYEDKDNK